MIIIFRIFHIREGSWMTHRFASVAVPIVLVPTFLHTLSPVSHSLQNYAFFFFFSFFAKGNCTIPLFFFLIFGVNSLISYYVTVRAISHISPRLWWVIVVSTAYLLQLELFNSYQVSCEAVRKFLLPNPHFAMVTTLIYNCHSLSFSH